VHVVQILVDDDDAGHAEAARPGEIDLTRLDDGLYVRSPVAVAQQHLEVAALLHVTYMEQDVAIVRQVVLAPEPRAEVGVHRLEDPFVETGHDEPGIDTESLDPIPRRANGGKHEVGPSEPGKEPVQAADVLLLESDDDYRGFHEEPQQCRASETGCDEA
jgi:hypothetical protein